MLTKSGFVKSFKDELSRKNTLFEIDFIQNQPGSGCNIIHFYVAIGLQTSFDIVQRKFTFAQINERAHHQSDLVAHKPFAPNT